MTMTENTGIRGRGLSHQQFTFLTTHLAQRFGLKIAVEKKVMLESRLVSRMNKLGIRSMQEYIDYAFSAEQITNEYQCFVDQMTTHKTFFFRERHQFDFLNHLLPGYVDQMPSRRPIVVWSAGCSTGEEVFTIGMCLKEQKAKIPMLDFKILGTDISVPSLRKAADGFFANELENLPADYRAKYFQETMIHGVPGVVFKDAEIKSKIHLGVLNLSNSALNVPYTFDFIFCRNVTIYFDAKTREEVLHRMVSKLRPGGFLFLGHSETAVGMSLPIRSIKPTIYQKV